MIVGRTMWTRCTSVTDGQTDEQTGRRTDRITITKTVQRIASHGKNRSIFAKVILKIKAVRFMAHSVHYPYDERY